MLPKCSKCQENDAFIYLYGKFYCGACVKKAEDKLKAREEAILEE